MSEFKENVHQNMYFNKVGNTSQRSNSSNSSLFKSEPLKNSSAMNTSLGLFRNLAIGKNWNSLDIPKPSTSGFSKSKSFNKSGGMNPSFGSISSLNSSSKSVKSESRWKNINFTMLHTNTQKCLKTQLNPKPTKRPNESLMMRKKLHDRFKNSKKIDLSFLEREKESQLKQNLRILLNAFNNFMMQRERLMKMLNVPFARSKTFNAGVGVDTDENVKFLLMLSDVMSKELRLNEIDFFVNQELSCELFGTSRNEKLMEAIERVRKAYFVSSPVPTEELNFQNACDNLLNLIKEATFIMWIVNVLKSD